MGGSVLLVLSPVFLFVFAGEGEVHTKVNVNLTVLLVTKVPLGFSKIMCMCK